jgi:hypothetical protein
MTDPVELRDPHCPTCGQPLRHGGHLQPDNAALVMGSGNAGITFETQGRCENEACVDFGRQFAPESGLSGTTGREGRPQAIRLAFVIRVRRRA